MDTDDIPQQVLMDLYAVTGELVINWGIFEASLNMIVNLVYRDFGGQYVTGESEPIPVPFTRRLNFLKTCFKKIPALASFRENERTLRGRAKELSFVRDFIAHGFLSRHDPDTGIYTFGRLDQDDDQTSHIHTELRTTAQQLMAKTGEIGKLFDLSHALTEKLLAAPRPNQPFSSI